MAWPFPSMLSSSQPALAHSASSPSPGKERPGSLFLVPKGLCGTWIWSSYAPWSSPGGPGHSLASRSGCLPEVPRLSATLLPGSPPIPTAGWGAMLPTPLPQAVVPSTVEQSSGLGLDESAALPSPTRNLRRLENPPPCLAPSSLAQACRLNPSSRPLQLAPVPA